MYLFFKRSHRLVVLLAVLVAIAALVGVAGPRVASADGAASEALLHKVYLGWIGGSIITPGPGEGAGGPLSFNDQNIAHLTVINEVTQTSVSATATRPGATTHVDRADEQPDRFREGYPLTVDFGLREGRNTVTVTVTSADGAAETAYVINITRKQPNGRLGIDRHDSTRSFRIPTPGVSGPVTEYSNSQWLPVGLSGDPTNPDRFWVASRRGRPYTTARITVNAYSVSQASFEQDAGFELPFTAVTAGPIWSDGQTMLVAGWWVGSYTSAGGSGSHRQVYAYQRSETGWARTSSDDVSASGIAASITGLSSDGETLWLTDWGQKLGGKVVAIDRQTKRRVDSLSLDKSTLLDAGITDPRGNWSDGETIWIAAREDLRLYAFDLRTKERISSLDIEVERTQYSRPTGIWSDGETMYVLQSGTRPSNWWVYAYDMHDAPVIETPPIVERLAGICDRTPQVRDAILAKLPDVSDCREVTNVHLAGITGAMNVHIWDSSDNTSLRPGDFGGLTRLVSLRLDAQFDVKTFPAGIFDDLSSLEELDLSRTYGISSLSSDIFDNLTSLERLDLTEMGFEQLEPGIFDNLANLKRLDMSRVEIRWFRPDIFDNLGNLEYLYLVGIYVSPHDLPAGIFDNLVSLKHLGMSGTGDTGGSGPLRAGMFDNLVNLEYLDLNFSAIDGPLPSGIFDNHVKLKHLNLGSNSLTTLPPGVLDNLSNLETFDMSYTDRSEPRQGEPLTSLPDGLFANNHALKHIFLVDNRLSRLPSDLLPQIQNSSVLTLSLNGNRLNHLPDAFFEVENLHLGVLYLDRNPGVLFGFSMEAELLDTGTGGNGLGTARVRYKVRQSAPVMMQSTLHVAGGTASAVSVTIPAGSVYSDEITVTQSVSEHPSTLTLDPVLTMRPDPYARYEHRGLLYTTFTGGEYTAGAPLTLFDSPTTTPTPSAGICDRTQQVQDAIIAKLNEGLDTPEVTDCATVTAEDLSGITGAMELSIEEIPALKSGDFQGLSNLSSLLMIDSGLETLPEDIFDGLTALHSLFIIGNDDLETLPEDIFDGLTGLTNLHVSGNAALSELPEGIFVGLTRLGFLHLAENSLTTLPEDIFDGLTGLQLLHLQNNQLTELPSGIFDGLGSLKYILLNGNSLRALPADVFEGLSSLTQLPLEGNNLESLPDGLFEGLVSLEQVLLSSNEGAPFTLTAELEQRGNGAFVVKVAEGSPFDLTVTLSAQGGTLSSMTVTVEAGSLASGPVSVSVDGSGPEQVTVTVESATFPEDREHSGIDTGLGQPLVLEIPGNPPAETVQLTAPASVTQNAEGAVSMSFGGLESDSDTSDTDYIFRADVKDAENRDADACEGGGMGEDRYMYKVDEDPEVRAATISAACPPGDYTVEVSISSPAAVELASATVDFTVDAPVEQQQAQEPPPSTDATLSGLTLSGVNFGAFNSATTGYTARVPNAVDETTVTPTTNDDGATHTIKLGGVADADAVIPLAVGSNVITIEVTAEDGNTAKTYTVTVTRAAPTVSGPAVTVELSPSGSVEPGTAITATMSFANLESDTDTSDTDYIFRADVVNADACEGGGMGNDRYMYKVDEDPEVRTGSISTSCAPGDYTVEVSISSPGNAELASATADFTVSTPAQQQHRPEPPSTDATLSGLTLSGVNFGAFTLKRPPATPRASLTTWTKQR